MAQRALNYIHGRWVASVSRRTFLSLNPATRQVLGQAPASTPKDVDRAVVAARTAYPAWRLTPAPHRGELLFRAAELLARHKRELGRMVTREMGKVLPEALGDVQEAVDMAYYMGGEGRRMSGETVPSELPNKDAKSVRVPLGVFALITPWNFPVAIPAWKIFPALVAGNTVVLKPSSLTPLCAARLVESLHEAGVPRGVLNMVHGSGEVVGNALVSHPGVDAVSFTGSCEVGERVQRVCGSLHRSCSAEMGGKNPIIVMEDADLDLAVEGSIWAGFGTTGQRCTAASRIIVHRKVYRAFLDRFLAAARRLRLGNGLKSTTDVGPVVSEPQFHKVLEYIQVGRQEGARLVLGGKPDTRRACARGYFIQPTIFADVDPGMRIAQEEIFGPVVSVMPCRSLDEAISMANGVRFGLSASIYSRDVNKTAVAERDLETGLVYINASTIGAEIQLPFGGAKASGAGPKEAGGRGGALDLYTRWKVIYRDFSGRLQRAQIDKD